MAQVLNRTRGIMPFHGMRYPCVPQELPELGGKPIVGLWYVVLRVQQQQYIFMLSARYLPGILSVEGWLNNYRNCLHAYRQPNNYSLPDKKILSNFMTG